jgi:hypothetical protein
MCFCDYRGQYQARGPTLAGVLPRLAGVDGWGVMICTSTVMESAMWRVWGCSTQLSTPPSGTFAFLLNHTSWLKITHGVRPALECSHAVFLSVTNGVTVWQGATVKSQMTLKEPMKIAENWHCARKKVWNIFSFLFSWLGQGDRKHKHRESILEEAHASLSPDSWRRQIFACYTERTKTKRCVTLDGGWVCWGGGMDTGQLKRLGLFKDIPSMDSPHPTEVNWKRTVSS